MTISEDEDDDEATIAPDDPDGDDEGSGPSLRGGYELPAGTVVPSRAYLKKDATNAARGSKAEMTRMSPIEDEEVSRPVKRKTATRASAAYVPSAPEEEPRAQQRRPSGQLKRRTSSGVMPEAPPRSKSRASMPIEAQRPSGDNISKIVDVAGMKERQRSRLKALISVLVLIGALVLVFVFKDNLLGALKKNGISEDGVPVRLSVKTNPPVVVTIMPAPGVKNRQPLELGRTPIDEQSGAFVGDTVLLVNEDRGIRYKEVIEYGQPNELKLISKVFKESAVRIRTTPPLKMATVWRGNYKLGQVGVNLSLFPGTHQLEIRSDQLAQPHQFTVEFADNSKNLDINEDVSAELEKK